MEIYGIPLDVECRTGTLGDAEVVIIEMTIQTVVEGMKLDVQSATIVLSKEDAVNVAALITTAATAEKEVIEDGE